MTMISLDTFYLAYYILHVPITILIDSSIVIPPQYLLPISHTILDFHISTNRDILLLEKPLWFKVSGFFELVFQLPLFFYFIYILLKKRKTINYYVFSILYGFNASFTTLICLAYVYTNSAQTMTLTPNEVYNLISLYIPYLLIPLLILIDSIIRINKEFTRDAYISLKS
ncbi:transmembrane protein 6/97 [Scheffersomyces coipomensis]|uniref:transmembrane protein 6/97 n=1 Tax=Scheffersomyces coipomensis TaxID=1788519 RepID=UPI00315D732B